MLLALLLPLARGATPQRASNVLQPALSTISGLTSDSHPATRAHHDVEVGAACHPPSPPPSSFAVGNRSACIAACEAVRDFCDAVTFTQGTQGSNGSDPTCTIHSECRILGPEAELVVSDETPADAAEATMTTYLMELESWPKDVTPSKVEWKSNTTVVIASYSKALDWLAKLDGEGLPDNLLDVVIYQKGNLTYADAAAASRRVRFYQRMRNFCSKGGSHEMVAYFQFILDFWANLPRVVIFSQDDCASPSRCLWYDNIFRVRDAKMRDRAIDTLHQPSDEYLHELIEGNITRDNCQCDLVIEKFFGARKYYWYDWIVFLNREFLGLRDTPRSEQTDENIVWPRSAVFVVTRENIQCHSKQLYAHLRTLVRVDRKWRHSSCNEWGHALERSWFRIFYRGAPEDYFTPKKAVPLHSETSLEHHVDHFLGAVTLLSGRRARRGGPTSWESELPFPTFTPEQLEHKSRALAEEV